MEPRFTGISLTKFDRVDGIAYDYDICKWDSKLHTYVKTRKFQVTWPIHATVISLKLWFLKIASCLSACTCIQEYTSKKISIFLPILINPDTILMEHISSKYLEGLIDQDLRWGIQINKMCTINVHFVTKYSLAKVSTRLFKCVCDFPLPQNHKNGI